MKSRPILFSTPMVLALLAGTKSQTRRVLKPRSETRPIGWGSHDVVGPRTPCPHGRPGDRLWVRETWGLVRGARYSRGADDYYDVEFWSAKGIPKSKALARGYSPTYRADWTDFEDTHWKPSIFMPRWASRITLEVNEVRVERLQDISEADAIAEGVLPVGHKSEWSDDPRLAYRALWEGINGLGSWDLNSWVWVVGFRRVTP